MLKNFILTTFVNSIITLMDIPHMFTLMGVLPILQLEEEGKLSTVLFFSIIFYYQE